MRKIVLLGLAGMVLLAFGCQKAEKAGEMETAADAMFAIGEPISIAEVTDYKTLLMEPTNYVDSTVVVEGEISALCKGSGCWISFACEDPEQKFYVKSPDHSFAFPLNSDGKKVKVEGVWTMHQHEPKEEGDVCPEPTYFLTPQKAVVYGMTAETVKMVGTPEEAPMEKEEEAHS